jgi:hypothetical protein
MLSEREEITRRSTTHLPTSQRCAARAKARQPSSSVRSKTRWMLLMANCRGPRGHKRQMPQLAHREVIRATSAKH